MTATIHDLLNWLEGARAQPVEPQVSHDDAQWLDRYLFDREWRADVDAMMARPEEAARS